MEQLYAVCCGIDVHKKVLVACLREKDKNTVRKFGTSTKEIVSLSDWLCEHNCEAVAMESTGSYWKPVYNLLEASELNPIVVNAQHMRNVPGRKTDVKDSEWIADLLQHGLLKPSFIPSRSQRELRELVGYRKSLIVVRSSELNRLQKMLEGGNIKLSGTISDVNGMSGKNILDHILEGKKFTEETYDKMLAEKKISKRLKATKERLVEDLDGILSPLQIKMMNEVRKHIEELNQHIGELSNEISDHMSDEDKEIRERLEDIPGIGKDSAELILAVIGNDMSRFPTDRHLCSWAGVCPGNNESAGKRKTGRTNKGNKILKSTLVTCAHSAVMAKNSYFYSLYMRISAHRGKKRAIVAVAHAMLRTIYHMIKEGTIYQELGASYHAELNKERKINGCLKRLISLGVDIQPLQEVLAAS